MLKLVSCEFEGLEAFQVPLKIENIANITSFIGPNGTGKSTILRILNLGLNIIKKATICDDCPQHESWDKFNRATLYFKTDSDISTPKPLQEYLGNKINELFINISIDNQQFNITSLQAGNYSLKINSSIVIEVLSQTLIQTKINAINQLNLEIKNQDKNLQIARNENKPELQKNINSLNQQKKSLELELEQTKKISIENYKNETLNILRSDIENFLSEINFPKPLYIGHRQSPQSSIDKFISYMMSIKKGKKSDVAKFNEIRESLERLLKNDVDIHEEAQKEKLNVNGVSYKKASSGTEIALSYFALTHMEEINTLVLWDEPENGLHPTRRYKFLDLMQNDNRQYILATHSSEFAQINNKNIRVFRCISDYEYDKVLLSTTPVINRQEAFDVLSGLGMQPARILFTANVTIWVEGPTELIFYHHWLKKILPKYIIEGFHYTFMQYGGGLINYIEADDNTEHSKYLFDILSLCRHPVILCDSDFSSEPDNELPPTQLKEGVKRLYQEVAKTNNTRPNAALLKWTIGREIENYLPPKSINHAIKAVWKTGKDDEFEKISKHLKPNKYEHYHETLAKLFEENDILTAKKAPKGITRWGEKNKVEFMRQALHTPNLSISDLLLSAQQAIEDIADFIKTHADFHS